MPFRWGPLIRLTTLFLIAAFAPSTVGAASYQKRDGTIVDPIMKYFYVSGVSRFVPASYNGANLEPTADLTDANLNHAILVCADLTGQMSGAFYCTNNVPNWPSNMDQYWRDLVGIQAILTWTAMSTELIFCCGRETRVMLCPNRPRPFC